MKKIFKDIVSKSTLRPEMALVRVTQKELVATDAYKMLIVDREALGSDDSLAITVFDDRAGEKEYGIEPGLADLPLETIKNIPMAIEGDYPDYRKIVPTDEALADEKTYTEVVFEAENMIKLLTAIVNANKARKNKDSGYVRFIMRTDGFKSQKPHVLKSKDGLITGMIMPINQR